MFLVGGVHRYFVVTVVLCCAGHVLQRPVNMGSLSLSPFMTDAVVKLKPDLVKTICVSGDATDFALAVAEHRSVGTTCGGTECGL